ncbi:MAG: hypothetical protein N2C12_13620 [Planctomycetales bacterium]
MRVATTCLLTASLFLLTHTHIAMGSEDQDLSQNDAVQVSFESKSFVNSETTSFLNRMEELEAEVAAMRDSLYAADNTCETDTFSSCCGPSWYGGLEVPILQPNDGFGDIVGAPGVGQNVGIRGWIGRQWDDGLGVRFSGFYWADSSTPGGPNSGIAVYTLDLEITQQASFYGWDLLFSGGVRGGGLDRHIVDDGTPLFLQDFSGAGLTFALKFDRPLCKLLNAYGGLRGSLL